MTKILVVEDDETLNYAVCKHLTHNGYAAKGCTDAREGLNALYTEPFDLIISDIMMPNMDGFAFAREVRAHDADTFTVFLPNSCAATTPLRSSTPTQCSPTPMWKS